MAKRTVKCQKCGISDTPKEEMEFYLAGNKKPQKKYYHKGECWQAYLKDKAFKAEEQVKKDLLNDTLKEIYGVKEVPSSAWTLLEALRGGNPVFGARQNMSKRYKEGYDYILIKETFEHCSETIEYYNRTKNFDGFLGAFKYALTIIIDKIYFVEQRKKERERQQLKIDKHLESVEENNQVFETNYKKPAKNKSDITDFLD
jgi:hypothetical protein